MLSEQYRLIYQGRAKYTYNILDSGRVNIYFMDLSAGAKGDFVKAFPKSKSKITAREHWNERVSFGYIRIQ